MTVSNPVSVSSWSHSHLTRHRCCLGHLGKHFLMKAFNFGIPTYEARTAVLHCLQCSCWIRYTCCPSYTSSNFSLHSRDELWLWLAYRRHVACSLHCIQRGTRLSAIFLILLTNFLLIVELHILNRLSYHLVRL